VEEMFPVIGSIGVIWVLGWIVRVISNNRKTARMATMQADLQSKLLDKFGSTPELLDYLQSHAGKNFAELVPAETGPNPYDKILWSVQAGIVLSMAGTACMFLRSQISEGFEAFTVLGALGIALGVGFLLSAAIAFLLSKKWGVINGTRPPVPDRL
jgi:hypothetical protein